jgi:hypothetical protein
VRDFDGASDGPTGFDLRSSVDNYADVIATRSGIVNTWTTPTAIDLAGGSFQDLASITFRIYGTGDDDHHLGSIFRVDNVTLAGIAVVPEPSTWALAAFGCIFVGARVISRCRRQKCPPSAAAAG